MKPYLVIGSGSSYEEDIGRRGGWVANEWHAVSILSNKPFHPFVTVSRAPRPTATRVPAHEMPPKKKPPAAAPLKPQGTGGHKRTPTSAFDGAAGKDVYEPEKVIAERLEA